MSKSRGVDIVARALPEPEKDAPTAFDRELKEAIEETLKAGARPENLRIMWKGHEWRWSPLLRRWDLFDDELARPVEKSK
jgi:hypothetical protein